MLYFAAGPGKPCRKVDDECKLQEFSRLPRQGPDMNPACCAAGAEAEPWYEDQTCRNKRCNKNKKSVFSPKAVADVYGCELAPKNTSRGEANPTGPLGSA